MSRPRASVIVRCYNEREHIGKLLYGVYEQTVEDVEVLLVDSGSTDGTLEVAREYPIDDVVYVSPEEFSFGRALNYGVDAAAGEFCVFASAHVYPTRRDWLERLLGAFEEDVALVYGKQRGDDRTKFPEKRVFRRWFPDHDIRFQESPFCNNANAAIRRSVWEEHRYDESLPGLEDLDWAKRVREDGWEISYAADAEIIHVHEESPREVYNRYRREAIAHGEITDDDTFTLLDCCRLFASNTLADYRAALREGELPGSLLEIPRFRLMQFLGTWRGFNQEVPVSDRLRQRFFYPDTDGYPGTADGEAERDLRIDYSERDAGIDYSPVED